MSASRKGANSSYFGDIIESVVSLSKGLALTLKHIFQATKRRNNSFISDPDYFVQKTGLVTLSYPYESIPVPDNGRYRLHNEIDDCIVCDKCAKICPVNCITIESLKATEEIGKTSDGTSKRLYAPIFDIDLAKCCYCGLCTTVCPTECLTMTKVYDFSEADVDNFLYKFSNLSPEESDVKRKELEVANAQKEAAKANKVKSVSELQPKEGTAPGADQGASELKHVVKPSFKPKARPSNLASSSNPKPSEEVTKSVDEKEVSEVDEPKVAKPVFKPKVRPSIPSEGNENNSDEEINRVSSNNEGSESEKNSNKVDTPTTNRPVFKPKVRVANSNSMKVDEVEAPGENRKSEGANEIATNSSTEIKSEIKGEEYSEVKPLYPPKISHVTPADKKEELPLENKPQEIKEETNQVGDADMQSQIKTSEKEEEKPKAARPVFKPKVRLQKPPGDNKESN